MKRQMKSAAKFLMLIASAFAGCQTTHDVAVTSFHVIDAPANYIRRHIDEAPTTTTTTTTTYQSDVGTPGHPLVSPTSPQRGITSEHRPIAGSPTESGPGRREMAEAKAKSSPSPSSQQSGSSAQTSRIPYAKPVPGKPGYVYSPFDPNGGYVDVTGYASGTKAKDPYSGKIFIVP